MIAGISLTSKLGRDKRGQCGFVGISFKAVTTIGWTYPLYYPGFGESDGCQRDSLKMEKCNSR